SQVNGLSRFGFLHMATHAFSDQFSGRLSGLALYDRDLWLDEWQQMGPLPSLVVLSACSSLRNLVYEGDELVGLTIGCLAAGAQRVVGSLWPVLDQESPDFMVAFYQHLLSGKEVAEALALAQRTAVNTRVDLMHWSGFQCVGQP
ncbi:MAG TPA: CHAT domain-containing protein, partial [Chloroflexota bacterium]|nr:CHAT domain-containing protein [Chloroflexota bacterium]